MPEFDISTSADEVVALLQQGRTRDAAVHLETLRQDQPPVIREALDRYIAVRGEAQLATLRQPGGAAAADAIILQPMLDRTKSSMGAPRFPPPEETEKLPQAQQHDVYASIVAVRGNDAARTALEGRDRVILGLRNESRTTLSEDLTGAISTHGTGAYNDRIVVLWTDSNGSRHAHEFNEATTEPTAQYDGHAKTAPRSPGFENVITRANTQGADVDGDGVRDLGRLAEGTTEMQPTTHPRRGYSDEFSLRPSAAAIATGANRIERDSNGDGWFDSRDTQGVQDLNNTFKFHRGSRENTDSAGCQTIRNDKYDDFVSSVRGTSGQNRWQYVLTSVAPGQSQRHNLDIRLDPANDPRLPQHADHALQQQISTHLHALGGLYAEQAEAYSLSLLYDAKAQNITRVDQIVTSNATGTRAAGETLFLVQGHGGDPGAQRIPISAAAMAEMAIDSSLQRLQVQQTQTTAPALPSQQQDAPTMGGR